MAKKNKEVKDEVLVEEVLQEKVVDTTEEVIEQVKEAQVVTEVVEVKAEVKEDSIFKTEDSVEIVDFYVRSYNGFKATVKGNEGDLVIIELADGTRATFKAKNLRKI